MKKNKNNNQNDLQKEPEKLEAEMPEVNFLSYKNKSEDVLKELAELREKRESKKFSQIQKDVFLIITRDAGIFNSFTPTGKFISDISSVVPELHIIYIGGKQQLPQKINDNTFLYTARYIPFFNFITVYQVVLSQLIWKQHFLPTIIVSIGDEIKIAKRISKKYRRPLYIFYSYMKILGKGKISMNALINACPQKIIIPNAYINKAIENHHGYRPIETEIKVLTEYIDVQELENIFEHENIDKEFDSKNKVFTMVIFPKQVNIHCFLAIKKISKEISVSITKFQFNMVVKPHQFLQAKILTYLFGLPIIISKEKKDSINIFRTSRIMLYFDRLKIFYEPVFYSFIAGCPVLSSGDEYSKIILFDSGFEEFGHLKRDGKTFGLIIKKLINDPYLYTKYKVNCIGFAETAFSHDRDKYITELRDNLNNHT